MIAQIARSGKLPIYFLPLLFLVLSLAKPADAVSFIDDVNGLAENARLTAAMFMQESFDLRLRYQYNGCSLNDADREKLYTLTAKASDQLQTTAKVQQSLKNKIEDYQGTDWEDKYGKTGLWKKLVSNLYVTALSSCGVDYYHAVAAAPDEKNKILLDILARLDSLDKSIRSPDAELLKAKATAQLARTELTYKPSAIHQLNSLADELNVPECARFATAIEKINFLGNSDPEKIDELLNKLAHSSCRDDLELVLPLAFFQRQKDPAVFEKIVEKWPQAQSPLSAIVLTDVLNKLTNKQDIAEISTFDAELAVLAAWKNHPQNYSQLLEKIAYVEKFQTPLVLYVTAIASANVYPRKAVDLLVRAGKLQQTAKNSRLDIEPAKIAEQAARLAYNLFLKDSSACPLATETFQNYLTLAADKADIRLEYSYASILNQCGRTKQAKDILKKIADMPQTSQTDIWQKRATLDLILQSIPQNSSKAAAIDQLASLIADCPSDNNDIAQLRNEAVTIYCQLLLETGDTASAQKALDILNDSETDNQPALILLKSKAYLQLNNFTDSAKTLLDISDPNYITSNNHAMDLLSQIIERIDLLGEQKDFQPTMRNCKKIAQTCYSRLRNPQKYKAGLYLAEITIFCDENQQGKNFQVSKLLSDLAKNNSEDINLVRCQARLLTEQNKFEQAADLWAKVAKGFEPQHSDRFWQAKYFELYCAAKVTKIPKSAVAHSIEVLENTFPDISPLWAQKLKLLKQNCLADTNNI